MPAKWWFAALCCLPLLSNAENENEDISPDLAFLEFLGSFDSQDDSWLENELDDASNDDTTSQDNGQSTVTPGGGQYE